jgi:hypothetical protein
VTAGTSLLMTPGGCTIADFGGSPLPADFFGPGSDPFAGSVPLVGEPLTGVGLLEDTDTIVSRLANADLPVCGSTDTVPIEIVALSLVSFESIHVTFNGGASSSVYEVRACLSSSATQVPGTMNIQRTHQDGGTFDSSLPVMPKLTFTRVAGSNGLGSVTLDPGIQITLAVDPAFPGHWSYDDGSIGLGSSPGGIVDHDCDPNTPGVVFPPSSNFFVGVDYPGADCAVPGATPEKVLTQHAELLATHCILPACPLPDVVYCTCDGPPNLSGPCGNVGLPGHGCNNSQGTGGGLLAASGTAEVAADTLQLDVSFMPPTTIGLLVQGTSGAVGVFGDGLLCISGQIRRIKGKQMNNGAAAWGFGAGDPPLSVLGGVPAAGGRRYYQVWYRNNPAMFCTPAAFNLTNGYSILWKP